MTASEAQAKEPRPRWQRELLSVLRILAICVPFALFFGTLKGSGWRSYFWAYEVSLIFGVVITLCIRINERWIVPHLPGGGDDTSRMGLAVNIGSYIAASMVGAFVALAIGNFTILHHVFSDWRSVVIAGLFSAVFTVLFVGVAYAFHFYTAYMGRVREGERFKARVEHEIRTAAQIQQALMPRERALSPRFEAAGASLPSRTIAGDFLDYFEVPGDRLAFVLGDVSGKGPPAAILAAAIQGMFFSVADSDESPAETLQRVNGALVRRAVESRFATVFHGLLTPEGRLVTCNAGHNPPLLIRRDGTTQWVTTGGLMVGVFEQAKFEEESFAMTPGDALVMFSDGVTEAESTTGEMYGEERLLALLTAASARSAAEIVSQVLDSVRAFSNGAGQADDITVLVVRYKG